MLDATPGFTLPSLARIAEYHPRWALAAAQGAKVRPDIRILSAQFPSTAQVGAVMPASYDEPITKRSIFGGCEITIDPTTAYPGNVLKGLNDATCALVTGVTFQLETTGRTGNFTPIPDDVPLQLVPSGLRPYAGVWGAEGPAENVKARFTLQAIPNGGVPFTAWLMMTFMVLEGNCDDAYNCDPAEARRLLRELGIGGWHGHSGRG